MDVFERMAAEHESLMADVARIRTLATAPDSDAGRSRLRDALETLRADLGSHFALEEEGGYMTGVTESWPSLDRKVGELLSDHTEIMRKLDALLADSFPAGRIPNEALSVIESLRIHEEAESSLVRKMVNLDMAAAD
jgi:hypothetical protein